MNANNIFSLANVQKTGEYLVYTISIREYIIYINF